MVRLRTASGRAAAALAMAMALGACSETMGVSPSGRVAEVETDKNAQASNAGNITSLTEVIERNPRDAAAYNTRGVVYAKLGQLLERRSTTSRTQSSSIRILPGPTPTAPSPIARRRKTTWRCRISTRRSRSTRTTRPLISGAATFTVRSQQLRRRARGPQPGDPAEPRRRAGLSRARAHLSAPGQRRSGDHRFQQRDRP